MTNSKLVLDYLKEKGMTIAFAESMTGGLATYEMIKNPGASSVIRLSIVTYSIAAKKEYLGITEEDLEEHTVVSEFVAIEMARGIAKRANANIGVGVTGNSGPTVQENTPPGTVWIGIVINGVEYSYKFSFFDMERAEAIEKTVSFIYSKLYELLKVEF